MQKDNDQRTDKELEVQEYLSQFDADEEISEDDTDISSFLMDDPEDSSETESEETSDYIDDAEENSDEDSSESGEQTTFDFTDVPNGDTDLLSVGEETADEGNASETDDENVETEEITVEEPLEYAKPSEDDLNLQDIESVENTDANLDSDDAAAGAAYVDSLLASERGEEPVDEVSDETTDESLDEHSDDESSEEKNSDAVETSTEDEEAEEPSTESESTEPEESVLEEPTAEEPDEKTDEEPLAAPEKEDSAEEVNEEIKEEPKEKKHGFFHRRKKKEEPTEATESSPAPTSEESDVADAVESAEAEEVSEEIENEEVSEEAQEELRDREIVAVSDALLEDDVKESEKHNKHEKKLTRAEKKAARKKEGRKIGRFLSLFVENPDYDASQGEHIVKDGKHLKNKPKKFSFFHLFRDCVLAGCLCVVIFICYSFVIITRAPKIDPVNIYDNIQQSSVIYNDKGKAVDSAYYTQDRKICKYEDMPENLVNAFVALEDKTFWKHHGFNWTRMIGAVFQSLTGSGKISGTSTITQQLARNVYLTDTMSQRSIKRKVLEMYYAAVIERKLSKEKIVEAYLNTIYLGFGNYGVEAASESYFGKEPKDLSLVQCAALAALPQAPDSYALVQMLSAGENPDENDTVIKKHPNKYVANDESKDRRETCLYLMKDQGYITDKEYTAAKGKKLTDFLHPQLSNKASVYSYFHEYLLDQVIQDLMDKYDYSEDKATDLVYTGGLNIYSTIDSQAQRTIVKEFKKDSNFPSIASYSTDGNGNIINSGGGIMLYDYDNFFNRKHEFKLKSNECKINDDGSLTIKSGYRLNIYTTSSGYSLEFK
ncbi:MAG: transglycosylase domain-containing protein, partial [Eubacteriales bacterium]|nr:transglycosylase domain-containing protein [Eubacteriales bacterium]